MKNIIAIGFILSLTACGGANDGNPNTDTTSSLPPDTSVMNNMGIDTANNINTSTGTYYNDTTAQRKNDVRSSSSAYPDGRGVTPGGKDSSQ
jgi:hypothetical protein